MSTEPEIVLPDYIAPVEAYRIWRVLPNMERLASLTYSSYQWQPGENVATCSCIDEEVAPLLHPHIGRGLPIEADRPHGSVPDPDCSCGFYGLASLEGLVRDYGGDSVPHIYGKVAFWDRVIVGRDVMDKPIGYRASKAQITELYSMPRQEMLAELVAKTYGVPVSDRLHDEFVVFEGGNYDGTVVPSHRAFQGYGGEIHFPVSDGVGKYTTAVYKRQGRVWTFVGVRP